MKHFFSSLLINSNWQKVLVLLSFGLLNGLVLRSIDHNLDQQAESLAQQNQTLSQLPALQTKLEATNQLALNNTSTLRQIQSGIQEISERKPTEVIRVLGDFSEDQPNQVSTGSATSMQNSTTSARPTPLGVVMVGQQSASKTIYTNPDQTEAIEVAKPGTVMLYYQKEGEWYQVDPPTHYDQLGWAHKSNLVEVPNDHTTSKVTE